MKAVQYLYWNLYVGAAEYWISVFSFLKDLKLIEIEEEEKPTWWKICVFLLRGRLKKNVWRVGFEVGGGGGAGVVGDGEFWVQSFLWSAHILFFSHHAYNSWKNWWLSHWMYWLQQNRKFSFQFAHSDAINDVDNDGNHNNNDDIDNIIMMMVILII